MWKGEGESGRTIAARRLLLYGPEHSPGWALARHTRLLANCPLAHITGNILTQFSGFQIHVVRSSISLRPRYAVSHLGPPPSAAPAPLHVNAEPQIGLHHSHYSAYMVYNNSLEHLQHIRN